MSPLKSDKEKGRYNDVDNEKNNNKEKHSVKLALSVLHILIITGSLACLHE